MIVLGINSGITKSGRSLNDGGACLVKDGKIVCAIQEERITRNKYEGGFEKSMDYVCEEAKINCSDINKIVVSSCIDEVWSINEAIEILKLTRKYGFKKEQIEIVGHHLSHAYCGFISSGYKEALVCVLDNTGNKLSKENKDMWDAAFERNSYYKAFWKNDKPIFKLLEQDASTKEEIGYGEAFRYFTHYFGWDSYKHAGKTMGLAPYGNPNTFKNLQLFKNNNDKEICLLGSKHTEPTQELKSFFKQNNIKIPRNLYKNESVTQYYADMAYFLQNEFEKSLIRKINYLINKYKLNKIVMSGGVALNCIGNGLIHNIKKVKDVYIPCAPGDDGQSMGNALFGYYNSTNNSIPKQIKKSYFGKKYSKKDWETYAKDKELKVTKIDNIEKTTAKLLTKGNIVGWFQKNSEFGPRALGHRSIIADPRYDFMKDKINSKIKFREPFRPFAPSFLKDYQKDYFKDYKIKSYFMSFGVPIISKMQRYIPTVTHIDGTARLQSVSKSSDKKYYTLIDEFRQLTNIPCIVNTSFNLNDEPIVETPINAINTFLRCHLDYLIIDNYLIDKPQNKLSDKYFVHVIIKKEDKFVVVKENKNLDFNFISGNVLEDETIPHAVLRNVKEQIGMDVYIKSRIFEDLIPKKNVIEHNIWFEVTTRNDLILPNDKKIEKYEIIANSELKKYLSNNYEFIPVFVKREQNLTN